MLALEHVGYTDLVLNQKHIIDLPPCCPVSGNPQEGSTLTIQYSATDRAIEVYSLSVYIKQFINGFEDVRSMEDMIKRIVADCYDLLQIPVKVEADLILDCGRMQLTAERPEDGEDE